MSKEMVISTTPHETRVAILEDGQLCEIYVEREKEFALVGSIYKGRVTRVLPGMQSSFVDIGLDSDAFLYVTDFLEDVEELDHVVTSVEDKVQKMEEQGGRVFSTDAAGHTSSLEPTDVEPAPPVTGEPAPTQSTAAEDSHGEESDPPQPMSNENPAHAARPDSGQRRPFPGRDREHRGGYGRGGGGRGRGRHDRRGGRRDNRRFGRDLPHSKYASHHSSSSYERPDRPAEPETGGTPGNYVPVLLPGESLARFKDTPATPVSLHPPAGDAVGNHAAAGAGAASEHAQEHASDETTAPAHYRTQSPAIEPLPGEALSHVSSVPPAEAAEDFSKATAEDEFDHHAERAIDDIVSEAKELAATAEIAEDAHGLSEEEAITLAEQVAEAQREEAALQREENQAQAAAEAGEDAFGHHDESDEDESEADEVEDEETLAEASDEDDAQHDEESETEEIAAAGEHEVSGGAEESSEGSAPEIHAEGIAQLEGEHLSGEPQPTSARISTDYRPRMQHPGRRGGRDNRRGGRGRRDDRGRGGHGHRPRPSQGGHRPQSRRVPLISDLLKQGQEIIVQIAKEPLGKKGARITSHVALPGRFLVYMPTLDHTGVSRKIASAEERSRLRHLVNDAKGSAGGGFIVRTAASQAAPDEVRADVEFLTQTWAGIKNRADQRKAPALLHRDLNLVERILRDYLTQDFTAIWVDSEDEYTKVVDFVSRFQPQLVNRVKLYTKDTPVYEEFGIQQEIDKGLRPKVWLKSGGYIVINHTEALVAIDVNTGKFVGKGSTRLEDTIVRTNLEAVKEIVRQMRLRDLGGIIIIDFIDMEERRNREKVMAALEDALKADRAPSKVLRFNEFGLVAITRKRTKQALERTLCQPCPYCTGSGMVKSIPTLCYEIQAEARKMAADVEAASLTLRVHPEIAKALKTRESSLMEELEGWTKKSVIIQADPTLHWEQYDIY
jgi:Rne/Rng family ribonuclease